ncbi:hypothetical protein [Novosphingobium sp. 9]|nr:hypothetical protein [Novosphingobium sp. 9]
MPKFQMHHGSPGVLDHACLRFSSGARATWEFERGEEVSASIPPALC